MCSFYLFCFLRRGLYATKMPGTCDPLGSASQVLGFQVCTNMPDLIIDILLCIPFIFRNIIFFISINKNRSFLNILGFLNCVLCVHIFYLDTFQSYFFLISFIHMSIQSLGLFSPLPPASSLFPQSLPYQVETILPLSLILLKREYKQ
jgi:hypothetical protein